MSVVCVAVLVAGTIAQLKITSAADAFEAISVARARHRTADEVWLVMVFTEYSTAREIQAQPHKCEDY
jgi:hypothetical protein